MNSFHTRRPLSPIAEHPQPDVDAIQTMVLNSTLGQDQALALVGSLKSGDTLDVASTISESTLLEVLPFLPLGVKISFHHGIPASTLQQAASLLRSGHLISLAPDAEIALFDITAKHLQASVCLFIELGTSRHAARTAALGLLNAGIIELHPGIQKNTATAIAAALPDHAGLFLRCTMAMETILSAVRALRHANTLHINSYFYLQELFAIASIMPNQSMLALWGREPCSRAVLTQLQYILAAKQGIPSFHGMITRNHDYLAIFFDASQQTETKKPHQKEDVSINTYTPR